jgi:hypothetical protein
MHSALTAAANNSPLLALFKASHAVHAFNTTPPKPAGADTVPTATLHAGVMQRSRTEPASQLPPLHRATAVDEPAPAADDADGVASTDNIFWRQLLRRTQ